MRTLHIIDRVDKRLGGAMQAMFGVCKYLVLSGQNVVCAASTGPDDDVTHLPSEFPDVGVKLFKRSAPVRYANSREFVRWLPTALMDYDLIEIHAIFSIFTWRAAMICRAAGKPYFIRPHGSLDPFDLRKHAWVKQIIGPLLIRPILTGSKAVLLTAPLEAERLVTYGATVNKVIMPLPVTLSDNYADGPRFRAKHRIPSDAQVVLFMSRVDYKKGLDSLIPALARLKKEFPKLWFVMAGTGTPEFTARVQGWLGEYGIGSFTSKVGFVSGQEKLDALAAADIFALPSLNENFGIVNIEAMYAGLPLLISDEVYICREIEEAGAGVICSTNADSVIEKLRTMLNGAIDLRMMGERGRYLVQSRYRPEAATDALVRLYHSTMAGHNLKKTDEC